MKKYFFGNHRFVLYNPEIVNRHELDREKSMPEQGRISEIVGQIQDLDAQFDQRTIEARQRLLRIEEDFNTRVASFSPEKRRELALRISHVYDLIKSLERSHDFSIGAYQHGNDPLVHKEKLLVDQQSLQKTIERFGVPGLKLVQAKMTARSREEYGVELNGTILGNIITLESVIQRERSSEASIIAQLEKILAQHGISYKKVESTEFAGLPYEVRIDAATRSFVEGLSVKVTRDGIHGIFGPGDVFPISIRWNEPETKIVEFRILSSVDQIWKLIVTDEDGTKDTVTFKGNSLLDLQQ